MRRKQQAGPARPEPPWIPAAMLGIAINTLAASVIAVSAGMAISKSVLRGM
jgi:hypothetical protein